MPRAERAKAEAEHALSPRSRRRRGAGGAQARRNAHRGAPRAADRHPDRPWRMRRRPLVVRRAASSAARGRVRGRRSGASAVDLDPYRGLGSWVDVFDYAQRAQPEGSPPPVTPESVDDMAVARCPHAVPPGGQPGRRTADVALRRGAARRLRLARARRRDAGGGLVSPVGRRRRRPTRDDAADRSVPRRRRAASTASRSISRTRTGVPDVAVRNDRIVDLTKRTPQAPRQDPRARGDRVPGGADRR